MKKSKLCKLFLVLMLLLFPMVVFAQENIDPDNDDAQYAWGENVGWLNLEPGLDGGPGVEVLDDRLTGWIWGENIGWISLSCENTGSCVDVNYGVVNDGDGNLSGHAWGENIGWINFYPAYGGGVYIDACGDFNGTAWGENIGWINFRSNGDNPFHVRTLWTPPVELDDIPPVTEITVPVLEWYNTDVSFTLNAIDCGSGVNEVYYSLDGNPDVATSGSSTTVSVTGEGDHTLEYFSVDINGNPEDPSEVTFSIDKTPPSITITAPSNTATYQIHDNVLADFNITDSGSGVDNVTSTVPNGVPIDTSTVDSYTFVVSATDIAGNSNSVSYSYTVTYPGNIDPSNNGSQYAYGENIGWINFQPSFGPGVTVTDTELTGYAWGENIGWIHLNPSYGGVINNNGVLSGYAWGENIGWINFQPTGAGVIIDPATGEFSGRAWGENVGWITFSSTGTVAFGVTTSWTGIFDGDGDGFYNDIDCDDADPNINPGATETCGDGIDQDCDGEDSISSTVGQIDAPVDPIPIGGTVTVNADYSDANLNDTLSAEFDWGDNSTSAGIMNQGVVEDSHEYSEAGVYTIRLTVSDNVCDAVTTEYQYIVVYDPSAGFVTGAGWIDSPSGAYTPDDPSDEDFIGKATFGFVSKYKKGAITPSGVTEFQFKVADLNFHSDNYDWLTIAGAKAMYKGIGTINGEGEYNFILSAIDADLNPAQTIDRFRIRIWQEEADGTEIVKYDNAISDDSDDAMTDIGGGSIVIHTSK